MSLCLPIAIRMEEETKSETGKKLRRRGSENGTATTPLLQNGDEAQGSNGVESFESRNKNNRPEWKKALMVTIPTFFDVAASVLMNLGLLSVTASVYQMLRGAQMLFAALFAVLFLKRRLNLQHIAGMTCCLLGIIIVGFSSIAQSNKHNTMKLQFLQTTNSTGEVGFEKESVLKSEQPTSRQVVIGMALIVLSQAVQAIQLTFEDYFMVI